MLNLSIAMINSLFVTSFVLIAQVLSLFAADGPEITSPAEGQVIQGNFQVIGTIPESNFKSAELAYAYANTEQPVWFIISKITQPASVSVLTVWDTTTISDGDYKLKLTVYYQDDSNSEFIVNKLLVRNYTPVEITPTSTRENIETTSPEAPAATPGIATITPFPENKAALSVSEVSQDLKQGAVLGLVCILGLGIYTASRGWLRRR